jgi:hypothetical protein
MNDQAVLCADALTAQWRECATVVRSQVSERASVCVCVCVHACFRMLQKLANIAAVSDEKCDAHADNDGNHRAHHLIQRHAFRPRHSTTHTRGCAALKHVNGVTDAHNAPTRCWISGDVAAEEGPRPRAPGRVCRFVRKR